MFILTVGGDLRYAHLTRLAAGPRMEIAAVGLERSPFPLPQAAPEDIPRADALILPNPWRSGMQLPLSEHAFTAEDVFERARPDALILLSDTACMPSGAWRQRMIDLSRDEEYVLSNAYLTAEGALAAAMQAGGRALMDCMCLVIGYGRIARRLSRLLLSMGAKTAVAARREEARSLARSDGAEAFPMEKLADLIPRAHLIFSTPPAAVLDEALLRRVRPGAHIMDLASPPFGFDLELARSLNISAVRESGLPGRYCPESAGLHLLEAVRRALDNEMKGDPS